MPEPQPPKNRWFMMALLTAIATFVAALPSSCMPPLFKEIGDDLGLDLVQIGSIWGIASLSGIFVFIIAGVLSDRLNLKLVIGISCVLVGITGALRGLSGTFFALAVTVFINGIIRLVVPVSVTKTVGMLFKGRNLGLAQGIGAMGMGFGLMLGPLISATLISPWLGGWRNVMYFYGGLSVFIGIVWLIFGHTPARTETPEDTAEKAPVKEIFLNLIHNKAVWLLGAMLFFRTASLMGVTGYVPTYLKNLGWTVGSADSALTVFYAGSTLFVVFFASISDKLGSRKAILFTGIVTSFIAISFIPFASGAAVIILMIFSGLFMDGFMAIFTTMLLETEGVGHKYSGTAIGVVFTIAQLGSVISPPIGNGLAAYGHQWPFLLWAALGAVALIPFFFTKETARHLKALKVR